MVPVCLISVTPQWDLIRVLNQCASTIPSPLDQYTDSTWGTSAESHVVLTMKGLWGPWHVEKIYLCLRPLAKVLLFSKYFITKSYILLGHTIPKNLRPCYTSQIDCKGGYKA